MKLLTEKEIGVIAITEARHAFLAFWIIILLIIVTVLKQLSCVWGLQK